MSQQRGTAHAHTKPRPFTHKHVTAKAGVIQGTYAKFQTEAYQRLPEYTLAIGEKGTDFPC